MFILAKECYASAALSINLLMWVSCRPKLLTMFHLP